MIMLESESAIGNYLKNDVINPLKINADQWKMMIVMLEKVCFNEYYKL